MNTQDDAAWKREFDRVEARQKQREGWELKEGWDGKKPPAIQPKVFKTIKTSTWGNPNEK